MAQTNIESRGSRGRSELIAALAAARSGLSRDTGELTEFTDISKRIRSSLGDAPLGRAAAALVAGLVGSQLLSGWRRQPKDPASPNWFQRSFPEFNLEKLVGLLLRSYLEPDQVDLKAMLRDYLK